jgi:hypothetical protein
MPVTNFPNGISAAPVGISGPLTGAIGAATSVAGAVTLAALTGKITTEALTTAAVTAYTLTITNSLVAAADVVLVSVAFGTNTTGATAVSRVQPSAGSVVVLIRNVDAVAAFNGTLVVSFQVLKAT